MSGVSMPELQIALAPVPCGSGPGTGDRGPVLPRAGGQLSVTASRPGPGAAEKAQLSRSSVVLGPSAARNPGLSRSSVVLGPSAARNPGLSRSSVALGPSAARNPGPILIFSTTSARARKWVPGSGLAAGPRTTRRATPGPEPTTRSAAPPPQPHRHTPTGARCPVPRTQVTTWPALARIWQVSPLRRISPATSSRSWAWTVIVLLPQAPSPSQYPST